ncbi:MAG TPA: M12 family metallo-peptidase [Candidatus Thermoplasmatota archaeon]|nr:M12 family metallo-peptidase [Candidatus Thermoplasmatota archaeon]
MRILLLATTALLLASLAGCTNSSSGSVDEAAPPAGDAGADTPEQQATPESAPIDGEPADCLRLAPTATTFDNPTHLATGWEERDAHLAYAVDDTFVARWGDDWRAEAEDLARIMDEFYTREVDLRIVPTGFYRLEGFNASVEDEAGGAAPEALMTRLIAAWDGNFSEVKRDTVMFLLGADISGSVAGLANCIGGAKYPEVAYVWVEAHDRAGGSLLGAGPTVFVDIAAKVAVHEFGHMVGAHHHYANCVEPAPAYSPDDAMGVCSVMINDVGLASLTFSSLESLAVRGYIESVDL